MKNEKIAKSVLGCCCNCETIYSFSFVGQTGNDFN